MVVQGWLGSRDSDRQVREQVSLALTQGSVPVNLLLSETSARLAALEKLSADDPGIAARLDPGYRLYDAAGASINGGPPVPAVASAVAEAARTGFPALSLPFERAGLWYAAIVNKRADAGGSPAGYEGIQFPVTRILEWWRGMALPAGSEAALITDDGRIWLRDPFAPALVGAAAAGDPFLAAVPLDPSRLSRIVDYDGGGIDGVVAWRSLETYGLVFAVGIDRDQASLGWYGPGMTALVVSLLVTASTFLAVSFARVPLAPAPAAPAREAPVRGAEPGRGLRRISENMPVVVFEKRVGADNRVAYDYVSPGLREIYGIEPAQLRANPDMLMDMIHAGDRERVMSEFTHAWATGEDIDTEYRIVMPGGQVKWLHNVARREAPGEGARETRWAGIAFDVTAQKQAETALREARSDAEVTSRIKAEFLANVSHELRTPLNAIIGFAEVISQETFGPIGVDKYMEYINDIHESADHLLAVVNDILDLSKIEAGRATLVLEDVDGAELADSCLRLIHGRAADARLQLRRYVEDSLPRLRVDPLKVKQILINLLSNAIKFTNPGGTVTLRVVTTAGGGIAFSVSDTGIGIAETDLAKAIESYGQVDTVPGGRPEGTGLGLPLAKALIELHGGDLVIESSAGKGTTVTARFPPECIAPAKRVSKSPFGSAKS
jgi:signal transduction histidine kinase